jgi:DNA-binding NarL/FixJ family response regulator
MTLDAGILVSPERADLAYKRQSDDPELEFKLPLRVALVEDSPYIRERLVDLLVEPGRIDIVGHADTEEGAAALVRGSSWDVLVLDLQLKRGTGLGVLRTLAPKRRAGTKVIVLTNYAFPQYRDKSLALGADYFFDKAREYHNVRDVLDGLLGTPMSEAG